MLGPQGDLLNHEIFIKIVVQGSICIDENTMTLPILINLIHNFRCNTKFCSQVNDRFISLVLLLSSNQLVLHKIHQVTFKAFSVPVVWSCSETDDLNLITLCHVIELQRINHDNFVWLVNDHKTFFVYWKILDSNDMLDALCVIFIITLFELPEVLALLHVSLLETIVEVDNVDVFRWCLEVKECKSCNNSAFPLSSAHLT